MIEAKNIHFTYESTKFSLSDISFTVQKGEIVGLVGKNGAGKTTLLNLITGFLPLVEGEVLFKGKPITRQHLVQEISYLPIDFELYDYLSLQENLIFVRKMRDLAVSNGELDQFLREYGLFDRKENKLSTLSTGMKQKFFF